MSRSRSVAEKSRAMGSRQNQMSPAVMVVLILVALLVLEYFRRQQDPPGQGPGPSAPPGQQLANRNVRFGLPAPASSDPNNRDAFLIDRSQYVLSYNEPKRIPNWVSWQLVASDIGNTDRGAFTPDILLPSNFVHVATTVYNKCGFDRGHICPSKDRSDTRENNDATFYTTNIAPQSPQLNRHAWERLEAYCRTLAQQGQELTICAGPAGVGGTGDAGYATEIGGTTKVTVPQVCWKVILVQQQPGGWPTAQTRTIAVIMPNNQEVGDDWTRFRVAPADVERMTGYRFFPALPPEIHDSLVARVDDGPFRTTSR
jgi:endonuclease G